MPNENGKENVELSQEDQISDLFNDLDDSTKEEAETELDNKSDEEGSESEEEGVEDVIEELEEVEKDEGAAEVEEEVGEEIEETVEEEAERLVEGVQEEEDVEVEVSPREKLLLDRIEELSKPTAAEAAEVVEEVIAGFIGDDEDIDEIISDKTKLNALLVKVSQATETATMKKVLQSIPQIIVNQVQKQKVINDAVEEFYDDNKELKVVKGTVGKVANEVSAENPEWTLEQVFNETGKRTRKLLGMKEKAIGKKKKVRKPAIPKRPGSGGRQQLSKSDLTELEKDVNELM